MRYKTEEDFAKAVKANGVSGLYLLYGTEEYLVDAWKSRLSEPFAGTGDFNLQLFEGRPLKVDALCDAAEALPLMASAKCVVASDIDVSSLSSHDMDMLDELLRGLNPDCVLILTGKSVFDVKSTNAKKLIALAETHGSVIELGSRAQQGLVSFLRGQAKRSGCELSPELARHIIAACGSDMNTLSRELDKVCAFAGYREIGAGDIDAVIIPRTEARVFDLSKHILAGNSRKAMETLADLFYLRESPIAILSTLSMSYVDLYRARIAKDSGVQQESVITEFRYKGREFRIKNAFNSRLTVNALRSCLYILCECDKKMKSTGVDDKVLLEQAVIQLFLAGGAA